MVAYIRTVLLNALENEISGRLSFGSCFALIELGETLKGIHNWPLQPFSQNYGLASPTTFHTTHIVCVNCGLKGRELQFKTDSEQQIFEDIFRGRIYFTLRVFARNLRIAEAIFFSYFVLMLDLGYEPGLCV